MAGAPAAGAPRSRRRPLVAGRGELPSPAGQGLVPRLPARPVLAPTSGAGRRDDLGLPLGTCGRGGPPALLTASRAPRPSLWGSRAPHEERPRRWSVGSPQAATVQFMVWRLWPAELSQPFPLRSWNFLLMEFSRTLSGTWLGE